MSGVSQSLLGLGVDVVRSGEKALRPKGLGLARCMGWVFWGGAFSSLGSAVISFSGVWGRSPAQIEFGAC